jgi:hypothetical protein
MLDAGFRVLDAGYWITTALGARLKLDEYRTYLLKSHHLCAMPFALCPLPYALPVRNRIIPSPAFVPSDLLTFSPSFFTLPPSEFRIRRSVLQYL